MKEEDIKTIEQANGVKEYCKNHTDCVELMFLVMFAKGFMTIRLRHIVWIAGTRYTQHIIHRMMSNKED